MSKRNDPKGHNRKLAVWGDMPRRDRRQHTTAGHRDVIRKRDCVLDDRHGAITRNEAKRIALESGLTYGQGPKPLSEAVPHSSYLDAIGVQEPTPRQIAARKAAATRAANKAAKGV